MRLPGIRSGEVGTGPPSPVAYFGEFTMDNGYFGPMGDRVSHPTACESIFGVASNFYDLWYFLNNVRIELDNPFIEMMTMRFYRTRYKLQINGNTVSCKFDLNCQQFVIVFKWTLLIFYKHTLNLLLMNIQIFQMLLHYKGKNKFCL